MKETNNKGRGGHLIQDAPFSIWDKVPEWEKLKKTTPSGWIGIIMIITLINTTSCISITKTNNINHQKTTKQ